MVVCLIYFAHTGNNVHHRKDEEVDEVCAKLLTESSANTSPNLERPQSLPAADYMEFAGASSNGMESQPVNGEPEDNPPLGKHPVYLPHISL